MPTYFINDGRHNLQRLYSLNDLVLPVLLVQLNIKPMDANSSLIMTNFIFTELEIPIDLRPFIPANGRVYRNNKQKKKYLLEPVSKKWFDELRRRRDQHGAITRGERRDHAAERKTRLLGTSINKVDQRIDMGRDLTQYQAIYHNRMTCYSSYLHKITDPAKLVELDSDLSWIIFQ
ncbi:hypothetical protein RirG_166350 [Rhizophagus irregularis DAOM 197198w]|uniref:Uncharacterized protein n=1 Tax=Rhizophagus irregularis (strain DAOM 197198w) TaxID=1432141 RepID=A0A015M515_RHIIW|nr:hypothetical protein RirG_166350 [Rhizophagus irregularis DAOM 197198w]